MSYTISLGELIEQLEEVRNELIGNGVREEDADMVDVLVASQPTYPLSNDIECVNILRDKTGSPQVWFGTTQSSESPYAPKAAWTGEEEGDDE